MRLAQRPRRIHSVTLLLIALCLAACGTPPRTLYSKFTIDVETPEGTKTGETVAKYSIGPNDGLLAGLSPAGIRLGYWGEATVIDLGDRGILFCVTTADYLRSARVQWRGSIPQMDFVLRLFPQPYDPDQLAAYADHLIGTHPKIAVSIDQLPLLIRFRDLNDPNSAERVDPNDLATSFGPGVRIIRSEFEILPTPKQSWWASWFSSPPEIPITKAIQAVLPWLSLPNAQLDTMLVGPMWDRIHYPIITDRLNLSSFFSPSYMRDVK